MSEIQLTKDSKELLAIIYKEYLDKINNGIDKRTAKQIGHIDKICALALDWLPKGSRNNVRTRKSWIRTNTTWKQYHLQFIST